MKKIIVFLVTLSAFRADAQEVVLVGTLHGEHERMPLYNYDTLRIVIEHMKPDLIIIEEDARTVVKNSKFSDADYAQVRPIEIRKVLLPYASKHGIRIAPTDERVEFDEKMDAVYSQIKEDDPKVKALQHGYMALFNENYLSRSIYDFNDDFALSVIEGRQLVMSQTKQFVEIVALEDRRQKAINRNILSTLRHAKEKKVCIVYGLTHIPAIKHALADAKFKTTSIIDSMSSGIPKNF